MPQVTVESLFANAGNPEKSIGKLMNEQANFTHVYEGYPEFIHFTCMTKGLFGRLNNSFRVSPWSKDVGALDFYEGLDFATKYYSLMESSQ